MYLNKFLLMKLKETLGEGDYTWSTIALQHASEVPLHKDNHNQRDSRNYVMEIKCDAHAGLWVEDDGDERSVKGGERPADHQGVRLKAKSRMGVWLTSRMCPPPSTREVLIHTSRMTVSDGFCRPIRRMVRIGCLKLIKRTC